MLAACFAARLLNQSILLEAVRSLSGHSSLQMSQHHARLYDSAVEMQFEAAVAELDKITVGN
jgi:site-specific recombinase XerC